MVCRSPGATHPVLKTCKIFFLIRHAPPPPPPPSNNLHQPAPASDVVRQMAECATKAGFLVVFKCRDENSRSDQTRLAAPSCLHNLLTNAQHAQVPQGISFPGIHLLRSAYCPHLHCLLLLLLLLRLLRRLTPKPHRSALPNCAPSGARSTPAPTASSGTAPRASGARWQTTSRSLHAVETEKPLVFVTFCPSLRFQMQQTKTYTDKGLSTASTRQQGEGDAK